MKYNKEKIDLAVIVPKGTFYNIFQNFLNFKQQYKLPLKSHMYAFPS